MSTETYFALYQIRSFLLQGFDGLKVFHLEISILDEGLLEILLLLSQLLTLWLILRQFFSGIQNINAVVKLLAVDSLNGSYLLFCCLKGLNHLLSLLINTSRLFPKTHNKLCALLREFHEIDKGRKMPSGSFWVWR